MLCIVIVDDSPAARCGVAEAGQCGQDSFLAALRMLEDGSLRLSPQLTDLIRAAVESQPHSTDRPKLSRRELDTLSFISRGFTHQQTATRMGVTKATVDSYVARARAKLKVGNKAELTIAALRYVEAFG